MLGPTGLDRFAERFPERVFDVGIAEQHAVTSRPGMAMGGLHPVVAVYATFLNRAFDQVLMDVALHKAGVTFVLDRAGVTGDDGASHNGMWDMSLLQVVPGMRLAAPRDGDPAARGAARGGRRSTTRPTVVRFPKGGAARRHPGGRARSAASTCCAERRRPATCCVVGGRLVRRGRRSRWPSGWRPGHRRDGGRPALGHAGGPRRCVGAGARHRLVVTVEDNGVVGGVGAAVAAGAAGRRRRRPVRDYRRAAAVPRPRRRAPRCSTEVGLTAQQIARQVTGWISAAGEDVDVQARLNETAE